MQPYYEHNGITIYHGDCREIMPELGKVDAVVTDPPYGMSFVSNYRSVQHMAIANDDDVDLLRFACNIPVSHSKYIFCRWDNLNDVPKPKSYITWVKNNWSMGDLNHEHARQSEGILFYKGDNHFFPLSRPTDVVQTKRTGNDLHPTQKPVDLMEAVIKWTDGLVLDPFMGSGTTLVAAKQLGRKAIGIELEEKYCEIAVKRLSQEVLQFPVAA